MEESLSNSKYWLARNRRKSKSCSPSRVNKTIHICAKENRFRKGDSLLNVSENIMNRFEENKRLTVVLDDLKNIPLGNINSIENKKYTTATRKSKRPKRKTACILEAEESQRLQRKNSGKKINCDNSNSCDSDNATIVEKNKPTALFTDDDIEGKQIFGFQSAKDRDLGFKKILEKSKLISMEVDGEPLQSSKSELSTEAPRTPRSHRLKSPELSKTPKGTRKKETMGIPSNIDMKYSRTPTRRSLVSGFKNQDMVVTPKNIRKKIEKEIAKEIDSDEVSEFSDETDDDCLKEESSKLDQKHSSNGSESSDEYSDVEGNDHFKKLKVNNKKEMLKKTQIFFGNTQKREGDSEYVLMSDNYFAMRSGKKNLTSNHTLDRLKNPQLTEEKLQDMMENISISAEHTRAIKNLNSKYLNLFNNWIYYMSEGYNILLYGIGSKRNIIDKYLKYSFQAINIPCFVVNGYFPGLAVKDILKSIMIDLLDLPTSPSNICDAVDAINSCLISQNIEIALAVHNIDGPMLRNDKAQYVFSKLASLKNIYFIASMDHIRAPLFWGSSKLRSFNFSWWDVTSMEPYVEEIVNENLSLVHKSGALALSSLKNVFLSLNVKACGIFFIIAKKQISRSKTPHYQGLAYQELYSLARESFLVSSDFALRTQLTEFIDHKLIKIKRTADGAEHLSIPIDNNLLQVFMEQQEL